MLTTATWTGKITVVTITLPEMWGSNIAQRRCLLGMTQFDLAKAVGVNKETVRLWEKGERSPRPTMQIAIAKVLRGDPRDIFPLVEVKAS